MVNFGPLAAEIGSEVWGTLLSPANFNRFRVLASLLQRRRLPEANQTLHDAWPSPGLVHYNIHFRGILPPDGISPPTCKIHFASKSCVLLYWQRTARHSSSVVGQTLRCVTRNGIESKIIKKIALGCFIIMTRNIVPEAPNRNWLA